MYFLMCCAKIWRIYLEYYEYEYDKNVELSIYYPTPESICLIILWTS